MFAEAKGEIVRDYRLFFMGHKGEIGATYTLHKRTLPGGLGDEMRDAYAGLTATSLQA